MRPSRRRAFRRPACLLAALLAALPASAQAAAPPEASPVAAACMPAGQLQRRLAESYGEIPSARGVAANGALLELWVSPGGRSFSLVVSFPPAGGRPARSCLIAAGEGWRRAADPAAGGPET